MTTAAPDVAAETRAALDAAKGDRDAAARALGIHRATLFKRFLDLPGLRQWVERAWPRNFGRRGSKVIRVTDYGGVPKVRTYVLECKHRIATHAIGVFRKSAHCETCDDLMEVVGGSTKDPPPTYALDCGHRQIIHGNPPESAHCETCEKSSGVKQRLSTYATRVYSLECGHEVIVPAVGVVRARVVCQRCKEGRAT